MEKYDIVIVGASTTGSYFAREMAKRGFSVLALEKEKREDVSRSYDIFHMGKNEMERFSLTIPEKGEKDYAFIYTGGAAYSPYGRYPKPSNTQVVGLHKHDYIMRMNSEAIAEGAQIIYGAKFVRTVFDENEKICGIVYKDENGEHEVHCKLVADCSGIASSVRTSLPENYAVENFVLTEKDLFYVWVYYVKYLDGKKRERHTNSFLQYKSWTAPQSREDGAILGVGANFSFDYAQEMLREFRKNVALDAYEIEKVERGITPYRRPPYSFVGDGFIAMGDCACLTKPFNGEGCTSSLYQAEIAVDVISNLLNNGEKLTRENMWQINKRYVEVQGKSFASTMAVLTGVAIIQPNETEYLFSHDVIFSKKIFAGLSGGIKLPASEIAKTVYFVLKGIANGKLSKKLCRAVVKALKNGIKVLNLYSKFPETTDGFEDWCEEANALWSEIGSMADCCDEKILSRAQKRKSGLITASAE